MKYYYKICFFIFAFLVVTFSTSAQGFMITESLRDSNSENFEFGGDPLAILTSGATDANDNFIDPEGDGWLRLTQDLKYQRGYAVVIDSFPSSLGVQVDLEFKIWRTDPLNSGADGFSVFLFDAKEDSFKIGGFGGSLGYAQFDNVGAEKSIGLSSGYVGFGIDEFGNFSKEDEGRIGGEGFHGNSIGVRGPAPKYEWIKGNFDLLLKKNLTLQYDNANITKRPSDSAYYRRIQIEIIPGQGNGKQYAIKARMKEKKRGKFIDVLDPTLLPTLPPAMLRLGFAASTGDCINYHELRNLYITTPGGVRVTKQVNKSNAKVGDTLTYTVDVYNQTGVLLRGLNLKDPMDGLSPCFVRTDTIGFDKNGYTRTSWPSGSYPNDLSDVMLDMEANSQATFTYKGVIKGWPADSTLTNTAIFKINSASQIEDKDLKNDTATVVTNVEYTPITAKLDRQDSVLINTPKIVYVLNNDTWEQPYLIDTTSIEVERLPLHGEAVPNHINGTIVYTPFPDFVGIDTFSYRIKEKIRARESRALVIITISDPLDKIFIPNVITPGHVDGLNDVFKIKGIDRFPNTKLRICNRWGDEVYYNSNYANDWDGKGLNAGTYYYTLILNDKGEKIVKRGWVLLKR